MTVAEAQRRRVLHALVLVVILIMASLSLIRYLSPAEQARMVKDSGLTAITVFGMIVSIFVVSFMIPHEIETRTIYPVLAKPVRRYEFLLGKYVGALVILGAVVGVSDGRAGGGLGPGGPLRSAHGRLRVRSLAARA